MAVSVGGLDLAIKSGLLRLRSAQPLWESYQAYQTFDHVRTTLGNIKCNLAASQAVARPRRRINTAHMNPSIRTAGKPVRWELS
jgi:hypothetical protein